MHSYLDETGNLLGDSGKYFVVATFTIGDSRRITKAFRQWQRSKFPRILKHQTEVKFNDSHLTEELRLKTLQFLAKQDIRIFYTFVKVSNIPKEYRKKGVVHETGLLYTEIVASTLELYLPILEPEFIVIRDHRSLKSVTLGLFNETIKRRLLPQLLAKAIFQIKAVDSTTSTGVQIADWVCGSLGRYYEEKKLGQEFYKALKNNIVQEKELFPNNWTRAEEK